MIRVACEDGGEVWRSYGEAVGLDKLRETFGEHWPPPASRPLEAVYVWYDGERRLAWLSLARSQFDQTVAHMSRGVWPDCHGMGLGREMRAYAEDVCRQNGVASIQISVNVANWQHLAGVMADEYWDFEGVSFNPASFSFAHEIKPACSSLETKCD